MTLTERKPFYLAYMMDNKQTLGDLAAKGLPIKVVKKDKKFNLRYTLDGASKEMPDVNSKTTF